MYYITVWSSWGPPNIHYFGGLFNAKMLWGQQSGLQISSEIYSTL